MQAPVSGSPPVAPPGASLLPVVNAPPNPQAPPPQPPPPAPPPQAQPSWGWRALSRVGSALYTAASYTPTIIGGTLKVAANATVATANYVAPQKTKKLADAVEQWGVGQVKGAVKQSLEENIAQIRSRVSDPHQFVASIDVIVDYTIAFLAKKHQELPGNNGLKEKLQIAQDPDLIKGILLKIFMSSLPPEGQQIASDQLFAQGIVTFLDHIQTTYQEIDRRLKLASPLARINGEGDRADAAEKARVIRECTEEFLLKIFPGKGKDMGAWYYAGVRGFIWSAIVDKAAEGMGLFFAKVNPFENRAADAVSPFLTDPQYALKVQDFNTQLSRYILSAATASFKDPQNVEKLLQRLKPFIGAPNFRAIHPPVLLQSLKKVLESEDPKTKKVVAFGCGFIRQFVDRLVFSRIDQYADRKDSYSPSVVLIKLFEHSVIELGDIVYTFFEKLDAKCKEKADAAERYDTAEVAAPLVKDLLTQLFPRKEQDLPVWVQFFLGKDPGVGGMGPWEKFNDFLTPILVEHYEAMYPRPGKPLHLEEYKDKLRDKLRDPPGAPPSGINVEETIGRSLQFCQLQADKVYNGFIDLLTKDAPGEKEFAELEKWLQKLKPLFEGAGFPLNHPPEILKGIRNILLSKDPRSQKIQAALKTFLGQLFFKAGVNFIIAPDNGPAPCPKHLLVENGLRRLADLVFMPQVLPGVIELMPQRHLVNFHQFMIDFEKRKPPLSQWNSEPIEGEPESVSAKRANLIKAREAYQKARQTEMRLRMRPFTDHLLGLLLPDLARHIPLPPSQSQKIGALIRDEALPDIFIEGYHELTPWLKEGEQNLERLRNTQWVKVVDGPNRDEIEQQNRRINEQVLRFCQYATDTILRMLPGELHKRAPALAISIAKPPAPPLPEGQLPVERPLNPDQPLQLNPLEQFISGNLQAFGNGDRRLLSGIEDGLRPFIYSACLKLCTLLFDKNDSCLKLTDLAFSFFEGMDAYYGPDRPGEMPADPKAYAASLVGNMLEQILKGRENVLPAWFFKKEVWKQVVGLCTDLLYKHYKLLHPTPGGALYIDDYKQRLRERLWDQAALKVQNPARYIPVKPDENFARQYGVEDAIDSAIALCQGYANKFYNAFITNMTKLPEGPKALGPDGKKTQLDLWIEKLQVFCEQAGIPDRHLKELIYAAKDQLISADPRSQKLQGAIKTYVTHLIFKGGVNLILNADDPEHPVPRDELIARGVKRFAALLCMPGDDEQIPLANFHRFMAAVPAGMDKAELQSQQRAQMRPLTDGLLAAALPDLEAHVPLLPPVRAMVVEKVTQEIVPDFLVDMYKETSPWMHEVRANEAYLLGREWVKETQENRENLAKINREAATKVVAFCKVAAKKILSVIPHLLEDDCQKYAETLVKELILPHMPGFAPNEEQKAQMVRQVARMLKALGDPDDAVVKAGQVALEGYVYAACLKLLTLFIKEVDDIERAPRAEGEPRLLAKILQMGLQAFNNYIQPLNEKLREHNKGRFLTRFSHISRIPHDEALQVFQNRRTLDVTLDIIDKHGGNGKPYLSPAQLKAIVTGRLQLDDKRANEAVLEMLPRSDLPKDQIKELLRGELGIGQGDSPEAAAELDKAAEMLASKPRWEKDEDRVKAVQQATLYKPMTTGLSQFIGLDRLDVKPLPSAAGKEIWELFLRVVIPESVGVMGGIIHTPSTKINLILTILNKFEAYLQRIGTEEKKEAPEDPSVFRRPESPPVRPSDPHAERTKAELKELIRQALKLAPQNIINLVYKHIPQVQQSVEDIMVDRVFGFLEEQSVVQLIGMSFANMTESLHPGRWTVDEEGNATFNPVVTETVNGEKVERNEFRFTYPRTPEAKEADKIAKEQEGRMKAEEARNKLNDLFIDGGHTLVKEWVKAKASYVWSKIRNALETVFGNYGKRFCDWLETVGDTEALQFVKNMFTTPSEFISRHFWRLVGLVIRRDTDPQIDTVTQEIFAQFENSVERGIFEVLNGAKTDLEAKRAAERAEIERRAREEAQRAEELQRAEAEARRESEAAENAARIAAARSAAALQPQVPRLDRLPIVEPINQGASPTSSPAPGSSTLSSRIASAAGATLSAILPVTLIS